MYNNKPWESEHAGYFNKGKDKQYHKEDKAGYNSGDVSSEYMRNKEGNQKDEGKKDTWLEELDEKKEEKLTDEEIPFKAAKQVFAENRMEQKDNTTRKKSLNSIEEAIKKAVEDEKKVVFLD